MDYRNRKYYLVQIKNNESMKIKELKSVVPSLKINPPYGHFVRHIFDGRFSYITNVYQPTAMLSCLKEDSEILEHELNNIKLNIGRSYYELTKSVCK